MARKIHFQFGLEKNQFTALRQYCLHHHLTVSSVLRELIDAFLLEHKKELKRMGIKLS